MALEQELTFNDYIKIIRRRFPYVAGFFFFTFLATLAIALKLPPVYQSTGTIFIESQQVQQGLLKDTIEIYATQRIEVLKQVVLTRENLVKLAQKYNLFDLDKKPKLSPSTIAAATLSGITINLVKSTAGQDWEAKPTIAFQISYNYYDSDVTYKVANDLVKLFLDENDKANKERVTQTAEFFGQEAEKQKIALEKIEKEITDYKRAHSQSLPQNKEVQVSSLNRYEDDLRETQREYSATQAELRSLDVALESAKAGIGLNAGLDSGSELEKLKLEFAKLSGIYSENHPTLRALQRRIESIEKNTRPQTGSKPVTAQSVMVAKIQAQIETANARLKSLEIEEANIRAKIRQTEGLVLQGTQTEGALGALLRDYDNAKAAYAEIKTKQDNAKISQNLEMEDKGERFVLIEAPLLPEKPIKPNRLLIILGGFFGAIAGAIALAVLMEKLDKRVRGVDALAAIMRIQPMAAILYITNTAELKRQKYLVSRTLTSILAIIFLVLLLVHFFVMPLDILTSKILARF